MPDHILGALRSSPTLALLSLGREWKRRFASDLTSLELTPRQFAVLCDLWESPGLSISDVGRSHGVSVQSAHSIVAGLKQRGLVVAEPHRPGASANLLLTEGGLALLRQAAAVAQQLDAQFTQLHPSMSPALFRAVQVEEDLR